MPQSFAEEFSSIPMSTHLGQSLERAHRFAREQSHKAVTLEHLLLALTEDTEAALILEAANIELGKLSTEVSGYLGRMPEDMRGDGGAEPRPDGELLRVLQAAASAAKQSRRKQIDGAIVLAAVVGDGKTPAAGLLKALGMTFEEAIRALQRANTKARLKPTPKPTTPGPATAQAATTPAAEPAHAEAKLTQSGEPSDGSQAATGTEPAAPDTTPAQPQSAEDILAAARARIQRRTGIGAARAEPVAVKQTAPASAQEKLASAAADSPPPVDPAETDALAGAIKAAMSGTVVRGVEAPQAPPQVAEPEAPPIQPPAPPVAQPPRPAWTPPPEPRPQAGNRAPQQPPVRPQPPLPARLVGAGQGPRRPPLPPPEQQQAGFPNRPPRAPWQEPGIGARPPPANGSYSEGPPARGERPVPRPGKTPRSPPVPRGGGSTDKGLLVESVPRRMRVGVPAAAEVRIARDRIDGLVAALNGRGAAPVTQPPLMRALSVRLRAPGGDFWIEPATPETQWVDSSSGTIHDDYAIWRWTVAARRGGRRRLTLMVSARTVGRDGLAVESTPPDRVIEVRVGGSYGRAALRWVGWIAALVAGAALGVYWEQIWALAVLVMGMAVSG